MGFLQDKGGGNMLSLGLSHVQRFPVFQNGPAKVACCRHTPNNGVLRNAGSFKMGRAEG